MNPIRHLSSTVAVALCALAPAISFADPNLVANASFESVPFAMSGYDGSYCYEGGSIYACAGALPDWSGAFPIMTSQSGAWSATPDTASDHFQIGLQNNSFIAQTIQIATPGSYTLTWSDAGRPYYGNENYDVSFGSTTLATEGTYGGQAWGVHSVTFTATAGAQLLQFQGLNTTGDSTAFIDNISLTAAVPEPSSWVLMIAGIALGVSVVRRRA
jgi:hypothetical protein